MLVFLYLSSFGFSLFSKGLAKKTAMGNVLGPAVGLI